jgi:hypothetical protein
MVPVTTIMVARGEKIWRISSTKDGGFDQTPVIDTPYGDTPLSSILSQRPRLLMTKDTNHRWSIYANQVCCRMLNGIPTDATTFHELTNLEGSVDITYDKSDWKYFQINPDGQLFTVLETSQDVGIWQIESDANGNIKQNVVSLLEIAQKKWDAGDVTFGDIEFNKDDYVECKVEQRLTNHLGSMWTGSPIADMVLKGMTKEDQAEWDDTLENYWDDDQGDIGFLTIKLEDGVPCFTLNKNKCSEEQSIPDTISIDCGVAGILDFTATTDGFKMNRDSGKQGVSKPFPRALVDRNNTIWTDKGFSFVWEDNSDPDVGVLEKQEHEDRISSLESHVADLKGSLANIEAMISKLSKRD